MEIRSASRAPIVMPFRYLPTRKGQIMASPFVFQAKIGTGLLPLATMWGDAAATHPMLCQQMGELVF